MTTETLVMLLSYTKREYDMWRRARGNPPAAVWFDTLPPPVELATKHRSMYEAVFATETTSTPPPKFSTAYLKIDMCYTCRGGTRSRAAPIVRGAASGSGDLGNPMTMVMQMMQSFMNQQMQQQQPRRVGAINVFGQPRRMQTLALDDWHPEPQRLALTSGTGSDSQSPPPHGSMSSELAIPMPLPSDLGALPPAAPGPPAVGGGPSNVEAFLDMLAERNKAKGKKGAPATDVGLVGAGVGAMVPPKLSAASPPPKSGESSLPAAAASAASPPPKSGESSFPAAPAASPPPKSTAAKKPKSAKAAAPSVASAAAVAPKLPPKHVAKVDKTKKAAVAKPAAAAIGTGAKLACDKDEKMAKKKTAAAATETGAKRACDKDDKMDAKKKKKAIAKPAAAAIEKDEPADAAATIVLGCGKCRGCRCGCTQCRDPSFTGKRWTRDY